MTAVARDLRGRSAEGVGEFTARVRPLVDAGLEAAVRDVPASLMPLRAAVASALGVDTGSGRRWRPLLTIAAAEAFGVSIEDSLDAAVAVELTHAASLVLDDLPCMDDSDERRGVPSTHVRIGKSGAILLAVGLLAQSAERLGRSRGGADLSRVWGETFGFAGMAGGQAIDVAAGGSCTGAARRLYRRKTTALAAFAVEAGGRVSGACSQDLRVLVDFGQDIGWAYQLVDDAHDIGEDQALGRAPGGRNPLRQGQRILARGLCRLDQVAGLRPGGAALLGDLAREIVRVPGGHPLHPTPEATSC